MNDDEEYYWSLLQDLKPEWEKNEPIPENNNEDDIICESCKGSDIISLSLIHI